MTPPMPPTTPPMIALVDEEIPPPLEELLSAREVDWGTPDVLAYVLAKVLPSEVTTVVITTTVPLLDGPAVVGVGVIIALVWGVVVDEGNCC